MRQLKREGNSLEARTLLSRAVRENPESVSPLESYAHFLDEYRDPEAIDAYEKLLALLKRVGLGRADAQRASRREKAASSHC